MNADITKSGSTCLLLVDVNAGHLLIRPSREKHVTGPKCIPVLKLYRYEITP